MDFPIPGSPPTRVSDPCTMPPPRTLSSSPMPVTSLSSSRTVTWDNTVGAALRSLSADAPKPPPWGALPAGPSTKVFHSRPPGHCPIHLEDSYPQLLQKKTLDVFAFAISCPYP